jgi:hypothetical protein
MAKLTEFMHD